MNKRKIPLRKCISCGEQREKNNLLRIVNNKEEGILIDITGKKNGRGAYVCKSSKCIEKLVKSKRLNSTLESEIGTKFYEQLKEYVDSIED